MRAIPLLQARPSNTEGGIDADQEEERSPCDELERFGVPGVGGHPSLAPASGDKVHQTLDVAKADGGRRRISTDRGGPRTADVVVVAPEEELLEAILGDQEVGDRLLAGTDPWSKIESAELP